jgi:hypothetical protein
VLCKVSVFTRQLPAFCPFTLWRITVPVSFAHTPICHQRVQFPDERTLISTRRQVFGGVLAFHEGMKVPLCAEA